MLRFPSKDPDEVLDYSINWRERLFDSDGVLDTITASTWIAPEGIAIEGDFIIDNTVTTVWLSGGTLGETYALTNRVTTEAGRVMDQSVSIGIAER